MRKTLLSDDTRYRRLMEQDIRLMVMRVRDIPDRHIEHFFGLMKELNDALVERVQRLKPDKEEDG